MFGWSPRSICLLVCIGGLVVGGAGWSKAREDRQFDLYGKTAQTQPIDRVEEVTHKRNGQVTGVDYNADFTFTTETGETVTAPHVGVNQTQLDNLRHGGRLELVYLPRTPTKVRFPGWAPQSSGETWGGFLACILAGAGFWMLGRPAR